MHSSVFPPRWCFFHLFTRRTNQPTGCCLNCCLAELVALTWLDPFAKTGVKLESYWIQTKLVLVILERETSDRCFGLRMWRDFFRFFAAKHGTLALGSLLTGGTGSTCSLQRWVSLFYHGLSCFIMFPYLAHCTIIAQATKSSSCTALLEEE